MVLWMLCSEYTQAIDKLCNSDEPSYHDDEDRGYIYSFSCLQQGFCGGMLGLGQHQPASWLSELEIVLLKMLVCRSIWAIKNLWLHCWRNIQVQLLISGNVHSEHFIIWTTNPVTTVTSTQSPINTTEPRFTSSGDGCHQSSIISSPSHASASTSTSNGLWGMGCGACFFFQESSTNPESLWSCTILCLRYLRIFQVWVCIVL